MRDSEFRKMFLGEFAVSDRDIALHNRLKEYYKATPDSMSDADSIPHWRMFRRWCDDNGYTTKEISEAMKRIRI